MRPSATGRILFWRGGSLWIGLAGEPAEAHSHHAVQISLPFPGGHVRLQESAKSWVDYTAALVAADHRHAFDARGQRVAQIFVDPESRDGRLLQQRHMNDGIAALPAERLEPHLSNLGRAYENHADDATLVAVAGKVIAALSGADPQPARLGDARIEHAVELMRERLGDRITLTMAAAAVNLSPDRFRHLFVQETGVGFRPYLLWLRLECSLAAYVSGKSLTDAAYVGGFADSAHFSRTFRRMFGITPASVRPV
jgi:transcriptional regulator GlxA family with amidase domain